MVSTRPGCRLPPELVLKILSTCTPTSLLTCSLVCRDWLPTCRSRLLEERPLEIKCITQCDRLLALLDTGTRSTLLDHFKSLYLVISRGEWQSTAYGEHPCLSDERRGDSMVGYVDYIGELAYRLKKRNAIEHLSLKTIPGIWGGRDLSVEGIFHGAFNFANPIADTCLNITNLQLSLTLPEEVTYVITYICSFPRLESLSLIFTKPQAAPYLMTWTPSAYRLPLVTLKNLHLSVVFTTEQPTAKHLWNRWMKTHPPSSLRLSHLSFVINIVQPRCTINPARVLKLCNKQFLKVLRLQLAAQLRLEDIPDVDSLASKCASVFSHFGHLAHSYLSFWEIVIDVSALTSLETLQIKILDVQYREFSSSFIQLFACIVRRISSTELHKLTVIIDTPLVDLDSPLVKEDWGSLDRAAHVFPTLPVLEVLMPLDSVNWYQNEKKVKEMFWRCWKDRRLVMRAHEESGKLWP
ncbi:hypothetical protein AAF712_014771 [Marasmius tenuissimus]|uniref:F-box domain-containing protein n=1 Tax=Marasmius tenuissimus TaxID=585030 RepID=A0ABR2ZCN2_9AGAR